MKRSFWQASLYAVVLPAAVATSNQLLLTLLPARGLRIWLDVALTAALLLFLRAGGYQLVRTSG